MNHSNPAPTPKEEIEAILTEHFYYGRSNSEQEKVEIRQAKAKLERLIQQARISELEWVVKMSAHHINDSVKEQHLGVTSYEIAAKHIGYRLKELKGEQE